MIRTFHARALLSSGHEIVFKDKYMLSSFDPSKSLTAMLHDAHQTAEDTFICPRRQELETPAHNCLIKSLRINTCTYLLPVFLHPAITVHDAKNRGEQIPCFLVFSKSPEPMPMSLESDHHYLTRRVSKFHQLGLTCASHLPQIYFLYNPRAKMSSRSFHVFPSSR